MCQDTCVTVLCVSIGTSSLFHDGVATCTDASVCAAVHVTDDVQTHMETSIQVDGLQILSHKYIDVLLVLSATLVT